MVLGKSHAIKGKNQTPVARVEKKNSIFQRAEEKERERAK